MSPAPIRRLPRLLLALMLGPCLPLAAWAQPAPPPGAPGRPPPPGAPMPPPGEAAPPAGQPAPPPFPVPPPQTIAPAADRSTAELAAATTAAPGTPPPAEAAGTTVATIDLEIAVNRARLHGDNPGLGAALLQLARHHQKESRPRPSLIALDEALALAEREEDDTLGLEAAQLAAKAYELQDDAAMAGSMRQRADSHRQRLARKAALAADASKVRTAAGPSARPVPASAALPAHPEPSTAAPDGTMSTTGSTTGTDGRTGPSLPWLLLPLFLFLLWAWRRSQHKAEALQEETERLARHQRQLKSAHQDLQQQAQQLRQTATHDALTGVLTRKAFASAFEDLARHAQHYGKPVSLMVFDLDHFKAINDSHGHLVGDSALKLVAGVVRGKLDSDDLFGRFGGDEFLVGCMDLLPEQALDLAEGIRAAVKRHAETGDEKLAVLSLSIGVANTDAAQGYDSAGLFKRADAALYAAKRAGRNRAMLADEATATGGGQFPLRNLAAE